MPETLRDLVVSLSLQSDNFTRNIRSVNKQIQEAESFFKLAAAGVQNFEQSTAGLDARLSTLQQKLSLQREVVDQYQRALQAARDKLQECYDRQGDYANRLAEARNTQSRLNTLVAEAAAAYADCKARLGESDQATIDAATHLNDLRSTYQDVTEEVRKLAGQCEALQRATQNAADAVSTGNSNLNKASVAVKQTEAEIDKTNQALALSNTNWRAAGESIQASQNALVSIGKQMQSADATFRLLTVDIKDVDTSTEGLSAKMVLLEERLQLQNRAVQEYQNILRATREQQAAAQSVNDADLIRQTTDAVTDAETALTRAQTAVRETEQAIDACNTQLILANSGRFDAAESIRGSEAAIAGIGNQLRLAESEFNVATAGIQNADTTVAGLTARSNMLTQQLNLQNQAVAQYANILAQAQTQLAAAHAANDPERINQATQAVTNAQTALNNANAAVKNTEAQLQAVNNELTLASNGWYSAGEAMRTAQAAITTIGNDISLAESEFRLATVGITDMQSSVTGLTAQLDMLEQKWMLQREAVAQCEAALQAAQQQLSAAQAAGDPAKIDQATNAVIQAQTALNNAQTAMAQTEVEINNCNNALSLAETNWYAAGQAMSQSQAAITSIGQEIKLVESAFNASTSGITNMETSVTGLSEKLSMLGQKLELQRESIQHYEDALTAARAQQDAAYQANDPEKIREANRAVVEAETALNNASAALGRTRSEIDQTNRQLQTARSMWTGMGSAATAMGTALMNSSRATGMVGRFFSTAITAPVTALGTAAIKTSIDFESSFATVRKTIDGTEEDFSKLADASKRMSTEVATSTTDINHVMSTGGQLGIATEHIEDFTRVMIDLEKASTDLDAYTAATQLAKFASESDKPALLEQLNQLAAGMDESSIVEYIGLLTQVQSLMDSGMSKGEVETLFPDLDFSTALDQLASLQQYLNVNSWDTNLSSLQSMFGEALPDEVVKIATDLDMTGAQARWDEFAANPGAITTDAIIEGIQENENAQRQQIHVDAVIDRFTEKPEGADKTALSPEGLIAYVQTYAEATSGADVSGLTPENIVAIVAGYQELAGGADVSSLKPSEIVAYIQKYLEGAEVDTSGLTPEALTATVLAYEEVSGGALTTSLTPDDITAMVVRYLEAEGVDVSSLKPNQIEGIVTKFSEAANCDRSALLQSLTAVVTEYQVADGVSLPTIQAKVGLTGYDTIAYRKFMAQNEVKVNGVVRLSEVYEDPTDVLKDEAVKFYDRNGIEIPVEMVPTEQLTADRIAALGSDGTLHVLIAPEVTGTEEAVAAMRTAVDEVDQLGLTMAGRAIGILPTTLMGFVDSALKRIETYKNPGFLDFAWLDGLFGKDGRLSTLDTSMQLDFDAGKIAELSTYVAEVVAAIKQGEEVKTEDVENLQTVLMLISELDTLGIGGNVIQGIAQGMTEGGWDSDAETVVGNLETALNSALQAHSPAQRMVPMGENVSAGIGKGASEYDFSGDAETIASALESALNTALQTALSESAATEDGGAGKAIGNGIAEGIGSGVMAYDFSSVASSAAGSLGTAFGSVLNASMLAQYGTDTMGGLASAMTGYSFAGVGSSIGSSVKSAVSSTMNSSTLRSAGVNVMNGLAAGIRAGRSGVVSAIRQAARAAVSAAKAELKIASPSGVFRDEVGVMAMRGFGVGALQETRAQARVLRNAARHLTEAAVEGATGTPVNSTRNYNQNSTVNLNVGELHVRDKQDIHTLAVEIATLTRSEQRGRGLKTT